MDNKERKEKEFSYGEHFACFFTNIFYIIIGTALAFWVFLIIGLLVMPEQTTQVIETLRWIFGG